MADLAHRYGATLGGALAHLPHIVLDDSSKPTREQADQLVAGIVARVRGRVGDLAGDLEDRYVEAAREAAHLGAASSIEAASAPELARAGTSSLSSTLWARFVEALDELAAELEAIGQDDEPVPQPGDDWGDLAYSFPRPYGLEARWPR